MKADIHQSFRDKSTKRRIETYNFGISVFASQQVLEINPPNEGLKLELLTRLIQIDIVLEINPPNEGLKHKSDNIIYSLYKVLEINPPNEGLKLV